MILWTAVQLVGATAMHLKILYVCVRFHQFCSTKIFFFLENRNGGFCGNAPSLVAEILLHFRITEKIADGELYAVK